MDIGFYIHAGSKTAFSGVEKKIKDQIKVLSKKFKVIDIVIEKQDTNILKSITWRLPFGSWGRNYRDAFDDIAEASKNNNVVFFYIRHYALDIALIRFLSSLRVNYPKTKILIEIPTYPYYNELLYSFTMWPWFFKDSIYRGLLVRYVNRIVTFSDHDEIFGIPTIKVINGIDVSRVKLIATEKECDDETIRFLAVAQFQPSHGYERIIRSLLHYYESGGNRYIEVHMVGDGSEIPMYKKMVHDLGLDGRVIFHGTLTGEALESIYEDKDIGLADFGLYKRKIQKSSALKVREYLAKGLPVACGSTNDAFSIGGKEFGLEFPNNESDIDISRLIDWYDGLIAKYGSKLRLAKEIRCFAEGAVDINVTMRPVMDYLDEQQIVVS